MTRGLAAPPTRLETIGAPFKIAVDRTGLRREADRPAFDPARDEVLRWLYEWGLVRPGRTSDGGFVLDCPWGDEHEAGDPTGAAYWLGGGFRCHHAHCSGRGRRELQHWTHDRLREDSGGLLGLTALSFPRVTRGDDSANNPRPHAGTPPGGGPGGLSGGTPSLGRGTPSHAVVWDFGSGVPGAFFGDLIWVVAEDKFWSLGAHDLVSRLSVDRVWAKRLEPDLPVANPRTGQREAPSDWFADGLNTGRAREADALRYAPGEAAFFEDAGGRWFANTWAGTERLGMGVRDADVAEWVALLTHICWRESPAIVAHILDWCALVVGDPARKPGWHLLLQGAQGLGKDLVLQPLRAGVGRGNYATVNAAALHGAFNSFAERRLAIINELKQRTRGAQTAGDQYTYLKEFTENTNRYIAINTKYRREYMARNVVALASTSNEEAPLAIEEDDRRWLVVIAGDRDACPPWAAARYAALAQWMEAGGAELVVDWLRDRWDAMGTAQRDALSGRAPETRGRGLLLAELEDPLAGWMREQIEAGAWPDLMSSADIQGALSAAVKAGAVGVTHTPTAARWGRLLRGLGGDKVADGGPVQLKDGRRTRLWATHAPGRFAAMSGGVLAQAYASAQRGVFTRVKPGATVTPITSLSEDLTHNATHTDGEV